MISDFESSALLPPTPERVLVIPRSTFEEQGAFQGFRLLSGVDDLGIYLQSSPFRRASFMDKPLAELDPGFKQLLPYMVIMTGTSVLTYRRSPKGEEGRLHGLMSIGVGGHVNDKDGTEPYEAFVNGAIRELKEEVGMVADEAALAKTALGLVNDDSNAVGEVHLGVVHVIQVGESQAAAILKNCENTMLHPQWVPLQNFRDPELIAEMETWSQIVMTHLTSEYDEGGVWNDPAWRERLLLAAATASNVASSAAGLILQENPRTHELCKAQLEEAIGQFQCIVAGLTTNHDIDEGAVKQGAMNFHGKLGNILHHQKIKDE